MHNKYTFLQAVMSNSLNNLLVILKKGKEFAAEKGIDESVLINSRLADDMMPLSRQVQIASDNAKGGMAQLAGVMAPVMEDTEATFDELISRVERTIDYVNSFAAESFVNADNVQITFKWMPGKYVKSEDYVEKYLLNNFFFHVVTAYDILRHKGIQIGKADYIGAMNMIDVA